MTSTERVASYIDGFNLYFGVRSKGRRHLWLDLEKLVQRLLQPQQQLVAVRYFTASVRNDPPAQQRQQTYLSALEAHSNLLSIHLGRFQQKNKECRSCGATWLSYEEKETDVSLAVSMIEDCANDLYDTILIVSADSDLGPAVRAVRRLKPNVRIVAGFPPDRRSPDLRQLCDAVIPIGMANVRQSQLPETVIRKGRIYNRPDHWK